MYLSKAHLRRIFMVEIHGYDSSVFGNSFICPQSLISDPVLHLSATCSLLAQMWAVGRGIDTCVYDNMLLDQTCVSQHARRVGLVG